ncbi:MAG TPA: thiamine-phosphate kinase [Stellaceae bacterium]|nr:thiamine-phosphate kinase [Stellaceae bacterium]HMD63266.1 thiamine-phosphate kinase [Stellaceae bacterium]
MEAEPLGEFERIRRFFAPLAGPGGLGLLDDAAILDCRAGRRLVVTADAIVEGVHYLPDDPPDLVARKLLRVNLSDLAAMGARPLHYLLTTALPAELGAGWVARFASGLAEDQRRFGIDLLGGDSVATPGPAVLSLTAIGEVAAGTEIRRNGARAGDLVWVSGTIGDAFLGLEVLRGAHPELAPEYRAELISRFQIPDPRVELGARLSGIARAMIDISDGLIADLGHVCETSQVAAVVELESLPLSPAAGAIVDGAPGLRTRLAAGGDDYELLFTAPAGSTKAIDDLSSVLGLPITRIGRIELGEGVRLIDAEGRTMQIPESGYRHF